MGGGGCALSDGLNMGMLFVVPVGLVVGCR